MSKLPTTQLVAGKRAAHVLLLQNTLSSPRTHAEAFSFFLFFFVLIATKIAYMSKERAAQHEERVVIDRMERERMQVGPTLGDRVGGRLRLDGLIFRPSSMK